MFAQRIDRITPSATLEMTAKAATLRSQGIDVLNLSVGEPDFNTPLNIIQAANKAMDQGITKYTPGSVTMDLKQAISAKLSRDNNLTYETDNIIVSCGGKHALYNACQVLFEKGDEVIIFTPYWVSFPDFVSVTGATPIFVNTVSSKQYEPDFKDLKNKITDRTKGIIINSPSNPTGGVWSDTAIQMTLEIAEHHNLWVFSDECYEQLVYNNTFKSIATFSNSKNTLHDKGKILTFQSCSKTYAMTGWRVGFGIMPVDLVEPISRLSTNSVSCTAAFTQMAVLEAMNGPQDDADHIVNEFKKRRDIIVSGLNNIKGIRCPMPKGAFYIFPNVEGTGMTSREFADGLLEEGGVAGLAGESFGKYGKGCVRFSFANSAENIERALERIDNFVKSKV